MTPLHPDEKAPHWLELVAPQVGSSKEPQQDGSAAAWATALRAQVAAS